MTKVLLIIALFLTATAGTLLAVYHRKQNTYTTYSTSNNTDYRTEKSDEITTTFIAAGDIMLSRNVAGTVVKSGDTLLPYRKLDALLKSTDFNFANLESPFSGRDDFNPTGSLVFNAPRSMIQGLVDYNFKILNLANNHALDQGYEGVDYTTQTLDQNKIQHIGTGSGMSGLGAAWTPAIVEAHGIKIAFIGASYAAFNDGGKKTDSHVAEIKDGIENNLLKDSITLAKSELQADFVVVTMHAGTEYTREPNPEQVDFAHAAIDAGADIVIGAHPHWIQTTEQYNGKYIFYSLGNFIFDQEWSQDTKEGLVLKIELTHNAKLNSTSLKQIELIPVVIENYCCPRLASDAEKEKILKKINLQDPIIK